jgi:large subunit ribosomal protein L4
MLEIDIKDINNVSKGSVRLPEDIFGLNGRKDILHEATVNFLANQRQGTHATKTRGMVSGGGKKPWRQKHTGRARAGSIRSPLWRGGGTVFGPQPRDYYYKLPQTIRKRALKEALSAKVSTGDLIVVESLSLERPKTKEMIKIIEGLGLSNQSLLIVLSKKDDNIFLSARNIPGVDVTRVSDLNPYELLSHENILMTRDALDLIPEVCKI